jgi:hypothetical protein
MLITQTAEFQKHVEKLSSSSMGTEHMGPLLYALIKFTRPHRVLEVGSGLTTIYILAALHEISQLEKAEFANKRSNYNPDFRNQDYYRMQHSKFCLHTFDNFKHPKTSAIHIQEAAKELGLKHLLKFSNTEYQNIHKVLNKDEQSFDMIWCDVGGLINYSTQQNLLLPLLQNRTDGYMIFHSTLSNIHGLAFLNQLKLDILSGKLPDLELMSFFEPHKHRQNSCTILRKKGGLSSRIYSEQP